MPVINAIEAALDRDLLLEGEKDHRYFAFDTREATRGDIQTRYNAYAVALQNNFMQLDEVRKLEDLEPLGVNYVKLGLNDVLLDPKTGRIYTPNTNAMVDMGTGSGAVLTNAENGDTIEERAKTNWIKGPDGKFQGSYPGGGGGGSLKVSPAEAKRVSSQFASDFPNVEPGKIYPYENRNHFYLVDVVDFNNYHFCYKAAIDKNEEKILEIRRIMKTWED